MNLLLFILIIITSFIVVRIGAVAFELTGLEWSVAKFQALSCFSGTGFTTREAELIVGNPQRRRIASFLMILGNAGLVTLIATLANTIRPHAIVTRFSLPFLPAFVPSQLLPLINLLVIIIAVWVIFKFFNSSRIRTKLTDFLRARLIKKAIIKPVTFEEFAIATEGYGVSQIEITKDSPVLNKTLQEADLRKNDIMVLAVEREGKTVPNPKADIKMLLDDKLVCFGKLENMRKGLYADAE